MKNYEHAFNSGSFMDAKICGVLNLRLTNIAVFLIFHMMMSQTLAAPIFATNSHIHPTLNFSMLDNPCGVDSEISGNFNVSSQNFTFAIEILKNSINSTLSNLTRLLDMDFDGVYNVSKNTIISELADHGFPKHEYDKYRQYTKLHPNLGNKKKILYISRLYKNMPLFGVAFNKLYLMKPQTEDLYTLDIEKRQHLILKMGVRYRNLLCEVQTILNDTEVDAPRYKLSHSKFKHIIGKNWTTHPDIPTVLPIDMGVFVQYKNFLKDWLKIARDLLVNGKKKKVFRRGNPRNQKKESKKRNTKPKRRNIRHHKNHAQHIKNT